MLHFACYNCQINFIISLIILKSSNKVLSFNLLNDNNIFQTKINNTINTVNDLLKTQNNDQIQYQERFTTIINKINSTFIDNYYNDANNNYDSDRDCNNMSDIDTINDDSNDTNSDN